MSPSARTATKLLVPPLPKYLPMLASACTEDASSGRKDNACPSITFSSCGPAALSPHANNTHRMTMGMDSPYNSRAYSGRRCPALTLVPA
ncbi:Uncharacterised protein [Mycobacteroides abscessus subsp. abscessus]|nr:Uncharacterised protein [Mycobacteroides abscessus subsp. abscessus]